MTNQKTPEQGGATEEQIEAAAAALREDTLLCHMDGSAVPWKDLARAALSASASAHPADEHHDAEEREAEQRGALDSVEGALYEVEGKHHVIGNECLCGAKSLIKNRDKTKHIARETIAALMGREVLDELTIV